MYIDRQWIEDVIRDDVKPDIYGDLSGVDRAADYIYQRIETILLENKKLKARLNGD